MKRPIPAAVPVSKTHYISAAAIGQAKLDIAKQLEFPASTMSPTGAWNKTTSLVDTGASACFVSRKWAKDYRLKTYKVDKIKLALADGGLVGTITEAVDLPVRHGSHTSTVVCYVTDLGGYDLILGMNWLDYHEPTLKFGQSRSMHFGDTKCCLNCLPQGIPDTVYDDRPADSDTRTDTAVGNISIISAKAASSTAARHPELVIWLDHHDWGRLDEDEVDGNDCNSSSFVRTARLSAVSQADFDKYMDKLDREPRTEEEIKAILPEFVHCIIDAFNPKLADQLPPRRPGVDHALPTDPAAGIPRPKIYGLSRTETAAVKGFIDNMMGKGFIRPSTSPYAAPVLVVKKPGGGLRICVDYRGLNQITRKNRNAPPAIKETLARLAKVRIMSLVDVVAAFNTVRVKEGDEEKTAFLTRYGLYEYMVMPFGLCNAPGTFQTFINETLRDHLDDFCTAYLDDVLIFSEDEDKHEEHVLTVICKLHAAGLYLDPDKCVFKTKRVKYLGLILTTDGIEMDPAKVKTVIDWQTPSCVKDVQAFLGFANFYRRFIKGFSSLAKPLTELTKEGGARSFPLSPDSAAVKSFEQIKTAFTEAGMLVHFDPDKETWLETDSSDFVTAAVLSQMVDGVLRPVAFVSHKMNPAECNYEIYDKELLAIVRAFEEWRFELSGTDDPIQVLSDHQALQTFMTTKRLNRRQARWAEFLSEFNFRVKYRPGKQGTKPDSLTRRSQDLPSQADDDRRQHQMQTILKPDQVDPEARVAILKFNQDGNMRHAIYLASCHARTVNHTPIEAARIMYLMSEEDNVSQPMALAALALHALPTDDEAPSAPDDAPPSVPVAEDLPTQDDLMDLIRTYGHQDPTLQAIMKAKKDGARRLPGSLVHGKQLRLELGDCTLVDGALYVRGKVYVPDFEDLRVKVIDLTHRSLCGGHGGKHESYSKISRWYYWPNMTQDIAQYVRACTTCRRIKPYREGKQGLLHPLPIPDRYWTDISMDYITHLPPCTDNGRTYTDILVIVDRLSKKKKFIPVVDLKVDTLVRAFVEFVWREEGYPESIVSDRGPQFVSHFWLRLCQRIGTKPKLSTTAHPETDGQTEIVNAFLKQYLRAYVNYEQDNWALFLPMAEFEANSSISATTGMSPFQATKGYEPRSGLEPAPPRDAPTAPARSDQQAADYLAEKINRLREFLRDNIKWAQAKQAEYANAHRLPAPEFRVGDYVMLDSRNIRTTRPSQTLDFKNRGPYKIIRAIDNMAYELDLPHGLHRIHNVFHPWLLHKVEAPLPSQVVDPEGHVEAADPNIEDDTEYVVEAILQSRTDSEQRDPGDRRRKGLLQYLVKWANYPEGPDNPSWEPYLNVVDCADLVYAYHRDNPSKPGPHKKFETLTGKQSLMMLRLIGVSG
jgi:hypothetical protein